MRRRLAVLVAATTLLVLVAFVVPLALLVRTVAADRAVNAATREAEGVAPLIATVDRDTLALTLDQLAHDDAEDFPLTVFFPDGTLLGAPAPTSPAVALARSGRSVTAVTDGGREILVAAQGGAAGTTVIRAFVSADQLRRGVATAWLTLGLLGLALFALSLLVADRLARSMVRPIGELASVAHRLASGDLEARAAPGGPPEVRGVAAALNLLAGRIGELLQAEREHVADLSHELRTPLTALRLDVEAVRGSSEHARLAAAVEALERSVDRVIHQARRPVREGVSASCDAAAVGRDRVAFWSALADEECRRVTADITGRPLPVRASPEDLATAIDALLGNVFAHTPVGAAFGVRLRPRDGGGAVLAVYDDGPGFPGEPTPTDRPGEPTPTDRPGEPTPTERGTSSGGSTGLGLDIVRRTAESSGGSLRIAASGGGGEVTVELGPPAYLPASPGAEP